MKDGGSWKAVRVVVSKQDRNSGVKIKILEKDGWKLRVQIDAPENREVAWTVGFELETNGKD